jgi:hypothetical protein
VNTCLAHGLWFAILRHTPESAETPRPTVCDQHRAIGVDRSRTIIERPAAAIVPASRQPAEIRATRNVTSQETRVFGEFEEIFKGPSLALTFMTL